MECLLSAGLAGLVGLVAGWLLCKKNVVQNIDILSAVPIFQWTVFFGEDHERQQKEILRRV